MATVATFDGDLVVRGSLVAQGVPLPANSVSNNSVVAGANIEASKIQQQIHKTDSQKLGVDAATEARVLHVVYGSTETLIAFRAGAVTPAGATTTVTVDLKKNGASVLSSVITLDDGDSAYALVSGTISSASLVAGDVLTVHYTLSGANEPQGVFCDLILRENQP